MDSDSWVASNVISSELADSRFPSFLLSHQHVASWEGYYHTSNVSLVKYLSARNITSLTILNKCVRNLWNLRYFDKLTLAFTTGCVTWISVIRAWWPWFMVEIVSTRLFVANSRSFASSSVFIWLPVIIHIKMRHTDGGETSSRKSHESSYLWFVYNVLLKILFLLFLSSLLFPFVHIYIKFVNYWSEYISY